MGLTTAALEVERAVRAIARNEWALVQDEAGGILRIQGAELAPAEEWEKPGTQLVLSGVRAAYLQLQAEGKGDISIPAASIAPARREAVVMAAQPETVFPFSMAAPSETAAIILVKAAGFLPAALVQPVEGEAPLSVLKADEVQEWLRQPSPPMVMLPPVRLPIKATEHARVVTFREQSGRMHLAVLVGEPKPEGPVVRLHSSCITGDILGSLRCDCGDQLNAALQRMAEEGSGILLYLDQEGRGIGIFQKMRAYALQDTGLDTVDANRALGFNDDERDFTLAAQMLKQLGFNSVALLTNNPAKLEMLEKCGIQVTRRLPLKTQEHNHNRHYLATKASRMGHQYEE